jgi:CBS domain containing-hemolysin-like protein
VAGYLLSKLGHIPKVGETFRDGALHFTVEEVRRNQIRRLIVRKGS